MNGNNVHLRINDRMAGITTTLRTGPSPRAIHGDSTVGYPIVRSSHHGRANVSAQTLLPILTPLRTLGCRGPSPMGFSCLEPYASSPCTSARRSVVSVTATLRSACWCIQGTMVGEVAYTLLVLPTYHGGMVGSTPCPSSLPSMVGRCMSCMMLLFPAWQGGV